MNYWLPGGFESIVDGMTMAKSVSYQFTSGEYAPCKKKEKEKRSCETGHTASHKMIKVW